MKTYKQFSEGIKDYSNQGKNVRVPGEDTASFGKLFKDDMKQIGKFKNPKTGKLEGNLFPISLSSLDFDATNTDVQFFTAEATFKYTIYDLTTSTT